MDMSDCELSNMRCASRRLNRGSVDMEDGKLSDKEKELEKKEAEVTTTSPYSLHIVHIIQDYPITYRRTCEGRVWAKHSKCSG